MSYLLFDHQVPVEKERSDAAVVHLDKNWLPTGSHDVVWVYSSI